MKRIKWFLPLIFIFFTSVGWCVPPAPVDLASDLASPGAIGGTTPAAGTFTTLTAGSLSTTAVDGERGIYLDNNTTYTCGASENSLFWVGSNVFSVCQDGTKSAVATVDTVQTLTNKSITALEVNGSAHLHLTAAQVSGTVVYNTGQTNADVFLVLPTAAAGYSVLFTVGTAQAEHWGVCANADVTDKIYLIAADGTVAAGSDDACVVMTAAQIGQSFACWTFKTDAYDWMCKAISIGTSTFAAHAAL
jgi:hypothetical protein